MTIAPANSPQHIQPVRIWLGQIFSALSSLDPFARSDVAGAVRRQVDRIVRLRSFKDSVNYYYSVEVVGGFLTVNVFENDIHFSYHESGDPLDPLPPRPHLDTPNSLSFILGILACRALNRIRNFMKIASAGLQFGILAGHFWRHSDPRLVLAKVQA